MNMSDEKKNNIFKITPVARYRELNRSPKQTTLTQVFCHSEGNRKRVKQSHIPVDEVRISEVSSPQIVEPIKYSRGTINHPIDISEHYNNDTNPNTPSVVHIDDKTIQRGDLVMTNAGRIDHPCFLSGVIADPYILFGKVQSLQLLNWDAMAKQTNDWKRNRYSEERIFVEWMTFEAERDRFIDNKNIMAHTSSADHLNNRIVKSPAVAAKDLTLIVKCSDSNLNHVNDFIREQVVTIYKFDKSIGWQGRTNLD